MNLDPKIWGPDADKFRPERWDELTGDATSPYAYEPFSNGPRVCIGKNIALLEMKAILIGMVASLRFAPSPEQDLSRMDYLNPGLTLRPRYGLKLLAERV